jgi:hypothetical protein
MALKESLALPHNPNPALKDLKYINHYLWGHVFN